MAPESILAINIGITGFGLETGNPEMTIRVVIWRWRNHAVHPPELARARRGSVCRMMTRNRSRLHPCGASGELWRMGL
jgi:hypothetical protein